MMPSLMLTVYDAGPLGKQSSPRMRPRREQFEKASRQNGQTTLPHPHFITTRHPAQDAPRMPFFCHCWLPFGLELSTANANLRQRFAPEIVTASAVRRNQKIGCTNWSVEGPFIPGIISASSLWLGTQIHIRSQKLRAQNVTAHNSSDGALYDPSSIDLPLPSTLPVIH
jgi:hypothetical protein